MSFAFLLTFSAPAGPGGPRASSADLDRAATTLAALPGLEEGFLFTPLEASVDHPYAKDGAGPPLVVQLVFDRIEALEACLGAEGPIAGLVAPGALPSLAGTTVTQQAMLLRRFPVDDPVVRSPSGVPPCSYLVHYPGPADDIARWHAYYIAHHPPIMRRFPGIRSIEILTRIDWAGDLAVPRTEPMQRNRILFDDPAAFAAALASPVIGDMRADFARLPPFQGGNAHYPMQTRRIASVA